MTRAPGVEDFRKVITFGQNARGQPARQNSGAGEAGCPIASIRKRTFPQPPRNGINVASREESQHPENPPAMNEKVKFEVYGEEMIEKRVKSSGNSGRVYLPPDWVGHRVKIIRID
jgi:putative transposon-encoded protein